MPELLSVCQNLMIFDVCCRETKESFVLTGSASLKHLPCDWVLVRFCAKRCNLHHYLEANTESSDDPFLWKHLWVLSAFQQNWVHCHWAQPTLSLFKFLYKLMQTLHEWICIHVACTFNMYCPASQTCEECHISLEYLSTFPFSFIRNCQNIFTPLFLNGGLSNFLSFVRPVIFCSSSFPLSNRHLKYFPTILPTMDLHRTTQKLDLPYVVDPPSTMRYLLVAPLNLCQSTLDQHYKVQTWLC